MRPAFLTRMALVAALVIVAGCSSNKGKIEATTWTAGATAAKEEETLEGTRRLQFQKDGQLFYTISGKLYKGNYTLGMGPAVIFTLDEDLDGRKIHPFKVDVKGEQMTLTSADGKVLTFQKAN